MHRNAHKSIFNAIELTGSRPVLVSPVWDTNTMAAGTVAATQISRALEMYPEARAVILTYPTYYGSTGIDLEEIIKIDKELLICKLKIYFLLIINKNLKNHQKMKKLNQILISILMTMKVNL